MNNEEFIQVIHLTPLVSIDLIVENENNEYLLGFRKNKPAQHYWFVPGGRVRKNETIKEAFERLIEVEIGIKFAYSKIYHFGLYEHFYKDNAFNTDGVSTHYIVNAFKIKISSKESLKSDNQHEHLKWFSKSEILDNPNVHNYTKDYFLSH